MFFPWLLGGGLLGLLLQRFFKIWNKLDDSTKKLIIEAVIKAFEEILRAFYKWWKQRGDKL
jgi:hypothetical protein